MNSYGEEDFNADCSSEIKDDMNDLGWKTCISTESDCSSSMTYGIVKPGTPLKKAIKLAETYGYGEAENIDDGRILLNDDIFINKEAHLEAVSKFTNTTVLIRDSRQKRLTLREHQGSTHLVCLFLQGNNNNKEATIRMDALTSSLFTGPTHQVTLSIVGHNLYLSCKVGEGDQNTPALSLMEATDIQEKEENDLLPFLFRRSANTNNGKNRFESVSFPSWYICTSQSENQFLEIKPESDQEHIRDFLLYPSS